MAVACIAGDRADTRLGVQPTIRKKWLDELAADGKTPKDSQAR